MDGFVMEIQERDKYEIAEIRLVSPFSLIRDWKDLKVDYQVLINMFGLGLSRVDIAFALGCTLEALEERVKVDCNNLGAGTSLVDLERHYKGMLLRNIVLMEQIKKARAGDTKMLIWMGKNYLQQSDDGIKSAGALSGAPIDDLIKIATRESNAQNASKESRGIKK